MRPGASSAVVHVVQRERAAQPTHLDGLAMVGRHPRPLSNALLNGSDDWVSATPAAAPGRWISCRLLPDDVRDCWQL